MERAGATTLKGNPFTLIGPELKAGDAAPDFNVVDKSLKPVALKTPATRAHFQRGAIARYAGLRRPDQAVQRSRGQASGRGHLHREHGSAFRAIALVRRVRGGPRQDAFRSQGASFGANWGTLIKELRIESRAIFVVDQANTLRYAEYVKEVADFPNYDAALAAAREAVAVTA